MSVGTGFRIDEKAVQQAEALRQRSMIWRDVLRFAFGRTRRFAGTEDRQACVAVGFCAIARLRHIAENLVVGSVLLDDVDHMLDWIGAGKQLGFHFTGQPIVVQNLLREAVQLLFTGDINQT